MTDEEFIEPGETTSVVPTSRIPVAGNPVTESRVPPEVIGQGADLEKHPPRSGKNGVHLDKSAVHVTPALSDRAAEAHVLSCLLLDPTQATLPEAAFHYPEHRLTYLSIQRLHASGSPVEVGSIAADLSDRGQWQTVGEWPFLFGLENREEIPTTLHLPHYRDRILALMERRQARAHAEATMEALAHGWALPKPPVAPAAETPLAIKLDRARVRLTAPPPEPTTRLFLAGKPIATPGNLVTVIAKSKTGKTAALGAATAAIIGAYYDRSDLDTFKFTAPHTTEAVILFDTEQSPYDAWTCHKRTMERAGGVQEPDWLHHYALVGDSAKTLRDLLPVALERGKTTTNGVFALILDGVADFVASVNDEAECNDFVTYLRKLAVDYNCPIICVIHSNEGVKTGDDGRGHLGKQLTRKAESNLLLKKAGDVTTITSEKQRKAPITEADGVAFRWSDEDNRHVSCDPEDRPKGGRPKNLTFETFENIWPRTPEKALTKNQILLFAKDEADVSEATLRKIIHQAVGTGQLVKIVKQTGNYYHLPA